MTQPGYPPRQGLYDPWYEHDACGVGFIADMKGRRSHDLVAKGMRILMNLEHRGACGCEKNTGDGAGITLQTPHRFLKKACAQLGFELPEPGKYACGLVYLPTDPNQRRACEALFERAVTDCGQVVLGWRDVPTDPSPIGESARAAMPFFRQLFIGRKNVPARKEKTGEDLAFERKLYVIRRCAE